MTLWLRLPDVVRGRSVRSWRCRRPPRNAARDLRIGCVAQSVAEEIDRARQQRDRQAGKIVRCGASSRCARPPFSIVPQLGVGGWTPRAEKAERRFADDRARHAERRLRRPRAGSPSGRRAAKDARRLAAPASARRLHVLELARAQHLAAHEPRVADPADDRQREQHVARGSGRAPRRARSPAAAREREQTSITRLITSSTTPPK